MSVLDKLNEFVPELAGALESENLIYYADQRTILVQFNANKVIVPSEFQSLKNALKKIMGGMKVALTIGIPSLKEEFFQEPGKFAYLINDIIAYSNPMFYSWEKSILWSYADGILKIGLPNTMAMDYFDSKNIAGEVEKLINAMFKSTIKVHAFLSSDEEERQARNKEILLKQEVDRKNALSEIKRENKKNEAKRKPVSIDKNILVGMNIKGELTKITDIDDSSARVIIEGKVVSFEKREVGKNGKTLISFVLFDNTGSILCKYFMKDAQKNTNEDPKTDEENKRLEKIKEGIVLKVKGTCQYDRFSKQLVVMAKDITEVEVIKRSDSMSEKRVELHAHTQMSMMDATVSVNDLFLQAKNFGHKALAITDNAVVQAYPEAFAAAKKYGIKILPGVEVNMVNEHNAVKDPDDRSLDTSIVVFDMETTGLTPYEEKIIEIGAAKIINGVVVDTFSKFLNPGFPIPPEITNLTKITNDMVKDADKPENVLPEFMRFVGDSVLAAHNAKFDCAFLRSELKKIGVKLTNPQLDTLVLAQHLFPGKNSYRLEKLCEWLRISLDNAHRAIHDSIATAECLQKMLEMLKKDEIYTFAQINKKLNSLEKARKYPVTLLAKNQEGIFSINKIVSASHLEYFNGVATIPKHVIEANRKGILIGTNSAESELFEAVRYVFSDEEIASLLDFYDYVEVQPVGNFALMLKRGEIRSEETVKSLIKQIIGLGKQYGKLVVATGEVHYLEEEDSIFRTILQYNGKTRRFADIQPTYYFRTTNEMLDEFDFLGEELSHEIVVKNTNRIADMIENVSLYPKHPEGKTTFSPVWENAEKDVSRLTYETAEKFYGNPLPGIVQKRIDKELNAILGYGYATLYSIAQKLVENSMNNGYLVGSRGSVGSSLVATMCNITEVNPLPPHYRCQKCKYSDFDVPKEYKVGVDLPAKNCPECGEPLKQDGFDIPFEVFLGFKGDKVPDIDLNFSGDYQAKAHAYVEELFGTGYVFRAGTIGTLQEKTARGLVLSYFKEKGIEPTEAELQRLARGCVGVKRTTGQHPGGMVILPKKYDINQFTAVQHPADDKESGIITTHYDFRSMHDILVKLDVLGHDDPTIIYWLEKWTGTDCKKIPLNDKKVMSLFLSPKALGADSKDIDCETGTLGIPEFGTGFVRNLLSDTKPTTMEELIRISGLSHGEDVWMGNAKDIIDSKTAKLKDCICVRDDIMNYLISMGMSEKISFDIMENVRKGKKLLPGSEFEDAMRQNKIPEWFIESCKKIGYLFPKGHAVAYVTMALRVAWYKVYYPLQYYAAYFSIRASGFNSETMIKPKEVIREMLRARKAALTYSTTAREKDEISCLEMVLEMNARGIEFLPVDLYKSDVKYFLVEDNKIRCPFVSLPNFGESAAESIIQQRAVRFVSVEDLKARTKVTSSSIELLKAIGAISEMSNTNQISFF